MNGKENLVPRQVYRLKDGRLFEFRYACEPATYSFLLGLMDIPYNTGRRSIWNSDTACDTYIRFDDLKQPLEVVGVQRTK